MPAQLFDGIDISLSTVQAGKIRRYKGLGVLAKLKLWRHYSYNIIDIVRVSLGFIKSLHLLAKDRPDIVFSKGGYPALPVCLAAVVLRLPLVTHDSDAVPGLSHRIVRRFVRKRLVGVGSSASDNVVGVPIRSEFYKQGAGEESILQNYNISKHDKYIVATGGGLGATKLNMAVLDVFSALEDHSIRLVLLSGEKDYELAQENIKATGNIDRIELRAFSPDMPALLRRATVLITRAGATSMAEAAAAGVPSIILPNGSLPGGHQSHNAQAFADAQAAIVIPSATNKVDHQALTDNLRALVGDEQLRTKLSKNVQSLARPDAATRTAMVILSEAGAA